MSSLEKTGQNTVSTTDKCDLASSGGAVKKKRQTSSSFRLLRSLREVLVSGRSSRQAARLTVYRGDAEQGQVCVVKAKSSDNVLEDDVHVTTSQQSADITDSFLPSRRLSMSADCVFAANFDFTSSVTGHGSADDVDVKSRDESKLSMSVEALPSEDLVQVSASQSTAADDVMKSSPVAEVDLSVVRSVTSSHLNHSAALHRRAVRPRRQRPVTQSYPQTSATDPLQTYKERASVPSNLRPIHSLEDISDKDTTAGREQEDAADTSTLSSNESPPKPVARSSKAPAGLNEMILRRHAAMFSSQEAGSAAQVDQDATSTSKAPVPLFRKRRQATTSSTRHGNQLGEQRGASSELTAVMNKVHRRSHSSSGTDALRGAEPPQKMTPTEQATTRTAAQQMETSEPVVKITTEKPAEKPAVKTKAADKPELAAKLPVQAKIPAEKQPTKMEKSDGKLSVAATADEQTSAANNAVMKSSFKQQRTTANNAVMKSSFKAATKPQPPAKTGLVTEKAENAIMSSSSPVTAKRGLSELGSTTTSKQEHTEASEKNVVEKGNKFQALEIPKVKLRSTSPTLKTPAAVVSCQPGQGEGAVNTEGVVTESDSKEEDVVSGECVGSASEPLTTGGSLAAVNVESSLTSSAEKNNETQLQVTLKGVTKSDSDSRGTAKDRGNESTVSRLMKSTNAGDNTTSDEMSPADAKQSESVRRPRESAGSKSEQSGVKIQPAAGKAASSSTQSGALVRRTTWRQTEADMTSTADEVTTAEKPQSAEQHQTSTDKDIDSDTTEAFVPVSKRASRFGSSSSGGRQFVGKSTGYGSKSSTLDRNVQMKSSTLDRKHQTDSSQSTDISSEASSGVANTVASRVASFRVYVTDAQTKATVSVADEAADAGSKSVPESIQPTQQGPRTCEAKKEVTVRAAAAAVSRWPPQEKSEKISAEKPTGKTTAAQCTEKSKVAEKTSVKAEAAAEKRLERVEEKSSRVMDAGQQTASKTSVPSWVKPPGTSSSKSQPKGSLGEPASSTAEPDTTASNPSGLSQKLSSIPSWVKPSGTSSSKNPSKDSAGEISKAVEPGNVTSVQSEKPSSGSTAASTKMTTSVVAVETTPSVPTIMSTSVAAPTMLSAIDFAASNRSLASDVSSQPVTSSEPPWLAVARAKTRVWTEGKI